MLTYNKRKYFDEQKFVQRTTLKNDIFVGLVVKRNIVFITLYIGNIFQGNILTEINGKEKINNETSFFTECIIKTIIGVLG